MNLVTSKFKKSSHVCIVSHRTSSATILQFNGRRECLPYVGRRVYTSVLGI
jgi:hypothetical protein